MATEFETVDAFLGHRGTERSGGKYLTGWKEKGWLEFWLHTKQLPIGLWRHKFPRKFVKEDGDSKIVKYFGQNLNCFVGATRFWANGVLVALEDVVEQTVEVIAGDGVHRPAEVKRFGIQPVRRIVFAPTRVNSNFTLQYEATPGHRWITSTRGEVTDLRVGDRVLVSPVQHDRESPDYNEGFVHGLIFGDGSACTQLDTFHIRLCGKDKAFERRIVDNCQEHISTTYPPSLKGEPLVRIRSDQNLKALPSEWSSPLYKAGFVEGWLAADGDKAGAHGSPSRRLCSINAEALKWVEERAPLLGWCVTGTGVYSNEETNYAQRSAPLRYLTVRPEPMEYTVREIVDEGKEVEVFCVVEPVTRSFVIEGGVVTGNCYEDEAVLKKQFKYKPDGTREVPPKKCPLCKMLVHLEGMVLDDKIKWTSPIFRFEGATEAKDNSILHAGGLYGSFGGKLSDKEKLSLKEAGVRIDLAWQENAMAKLSYAFIGVDNNDAEAGMQILIEPELLGKKVQKLINDKIESDGEELGNPTITPYMIKMVYVDKENTPISDKYDAKAIMKVKITPEIESLIRGEKVDLRGTTAPFNAASVRAIMEQYAVVDLPWDEFFADVSDEDSGDEFPPKEKGEDKKADDKPADKPAPAKSEGKKGGRRKAAEEKPAANLIPCDKCKHPMGEDERVCPKCGTKYEFDS